MAERVHPVAPTSSPPSYIIQVPKDQIYRVPPPENAHRYSLYTRRAPHRKRRRCCCVCLLLPLLLAFLLAASAATLYLIFRPKLPSYSIQSLSFRHNLSLSSPTLSPDLHVSILAENENKKIGIRYLPGGTVRVVYEGVEIGAGEWPGFEQGRGNGTVVGVGVGVRGEGIRLGERMRKDLTAEVGRRRVGFTVAVDAPMRAKVGKVMTWKVGVRGRCEVVMDGLGKGAKLVEEKCKVKLKLF